MRGDVASTWMVNATDGHTSRCGTGLAVGVPADPRVARLVAGPGVLVHHAEAVVLEQPGLLAEQAAHDGDERRVVRGGARDLRHLGDVADVVRERHAVDHRVGIVEDDGAALDRQLSREQALLLVLELELQLLQLGLGVEAAQHREAVFAEERVEPRRSGAAGEHARPHGPASSGRWHPRRQSDETGWRVWVKTSTRRMRRSPVSSKVRHSGVRNGVPSTSTVSESSANASEST